MSPGERDGADEELRLSIAILPLRLRIDQAVVDFCQVRCGSQIRRSCMLKPISCAVIDFCWVLLPSAHKRLHAPITFNVLPLEAL